MTAGWVNINDLLNAGFNSKHCFGDTPIEMGARQYVFGTQRFVPTWTNSHSRSQQREGHNIFSNPNVDNFEAPGTLVSRARSVRRGSWRLSEEGGRVASYTGVLICGRTVPKKKRHHP